jgi:hypothetical protein
LSLRKIALIQSEEDPHHIILCPGETTRHIINIVLFGEAAGGQGREICQPQAVIENLALELPG